MKKFGIYNFIKTYNAKPLGNDSQNMEASALLDLINNGQQQNSLNQETENLNNEPTEQTAPIMQSQPAQEKHNQATPMINTQEQSDNIKTSQKEWDYKSKSYMDLYPHPKLDNLKKP
jgi:hypothetical protein